MVDDNTNFLTTRVNYGEEFLNILDVSYDVMKRLFDPFLEIQKLNERLREIKEWNIPKLWHTSDYSDVRKNIDGSIKSLKILAETAIKEVNADNISNQGKRRKIEKADEGYSGWVNDGYQEFNEYALGIKSYDLNLRGRISLSKYAAVIGARLEETLKIKPSKLFDSLSGLKEMRFTDFKTEGMSENDKGLLQQSDISQIPPETFQRVSRILDKESTGAYASLLESKSPFFSAEIFFEPEKVQKVKIIQGDIGYSLSKEEGEHLKESVNLITGYGLSKSA